MPHLHPSLLILLALLPLHSSAPAPPPLRNLSDASLAHALLSYAPGLRAACEATGRCSGALPPLATWDGADWVAGSAHLPLPPASTGSSSSSLPRAPLVAALDGLDTWSLGAGSLALEALHTPGFQLDASGGRCEEGAGGGNCSGCIVRVSTGEAPPSLRVTCPPGYRGEEVSPAWLGGSGACSAEGGCWVGTGAEGTPAGWRTLRLLGSLRRSGGGQGVVVALFHLPSLHLGGGGALEVTGPYPLVLATRGSAVLHGALVLAPGSAGGAIRAQSLPSRRHIIEAGERCGRQVRATLWTLLTTSAVRESGGARAEVAPAALLLRVTARAGQTMAGAWRLALCGCAGGARGGSDGSSLACGEGAQSTCGCTCPEGCRARLSRRLAPSIEPEELLRAVREDLRLPSRWGDLQLTREVLRESLAAASRENLTQERAGEAFRENFTSSSGRHGWAFRLSSRTSQALPPLSACGEELRGEGASVTLLREGGEEAGVGAGAVAEPSSDAPSAPFRLIWRGRATPPLRADMSARTLRRALLAAWRPLGLMQASVGLLRVRSAEDACSWARGGDLAGRPGDRLEADDAAQPPCYAPRHALARSGSAWSITLTAEAGADSANRIWAPRTPTDVMPMDGLLRSVGGGTRNATCEWPPLLGPAAGAGDVLSVADGGEGSLTGDGTGTAGGGTPCCVASGSACGNASCCAAHLLATLSDGSLARVLPGHDADVAASQEPQCSGTDGDSAPSDSEDCGGGTASTPAHPWSTLALWRYFVEPCSGSAVVPWAPSACGGDGPAEGEEAAAAAAMAVAAGALSPRAGAGSRDLPLWSFLYCLAPEKVDGAGWAQPAATASPSPPADLVGGGAGGLRAPSPQALLSLTPLRYLLRAGGDAGPTTAAACVAASPSWYEQWGAASAAGVAGAADAVGAVGTANRSSWPADALAPPHALLAFSRPPTAARPSSLAWEADGALGAACGDESAPGAADACCFGGAGGGVFALLAGGDLTIGAGALISADGEGGGSAQQESPAPGAQTANGGSTSTRSLLHGGGGGGGGTIVLLAGGTLSLRGRLSALGGPDGGAEGRTRGGAAGAGGSILLGGGALALRGEGSRPRTGAGGSLLWMQAPGGGEEAARASEVVGPASWALAGALPVEGRADSRCRAPEAAGSNGSDVCSGVNSSACSGASSICSTPLACAALSALAQSAAWAAPRSLRVAPALPLPRSALPRCALGSGLCGGASRHIGRTLELVGDGLGVAGGANSTQPSTEDACVPAAALAGGESPAALERRALRSLTAPLAAAAALWASQRTGGLSAAGEAAALFAAATQVLSLGGAREADGDVEARLSALRAALWTPSCLVSGARAPPPGCPPLPPAPRPERVTLYFRVQAPLAGAVGGELGAQLGDIELGAHLGGGLDAGELGAHIALHDDSALSGYALWAAAAGAGPLAGAAWPPPLLLPLQRSSELGDAGGSPSLLLNGSGWPLLDWALNRVQAAAEVAASSHAETRSATASVSPPRGPDAAAGLLLLLPAPRPEGEPEVNLPLLLEGLNPATAAALSAALGLCGEPDAASAPTGAPIGTPAGAPTAPRATSDCARRLSWVAALPPALPARTAPGARAPCAGLGAPCALGLSQALSATPPAAWLAALPPRPREALAAWHALLDGARAALWGAAADAAGDHPDPLNADGVALGVALLHRARGGWALRHGADYSASAPPLRLRASALPAGGALEAAEAGGRALAEELARAAALGHCGEAVQLGDCAAERGGCAGQAAAAQADPDSGWRKLDVLLDWRAGSYRLRLDDVTVLARAPLPRRALARGGGITRLGLYATGGAAVSYAGVYVGPDAAEGWECPAGGGAGAAGGGSGGAVIGSGDDAGGASADSPPPLGWSPADLGPPSRSAPVTRHGSHLSMREVYEHEAHGGLVWGDGAPQLEYMAPESPAGAGEAAAGDAIGVLAGTADAHDGSDAHALSPAFESLEAVNWRRARRAATAAHPVNGRDDVSSGTTLWNAADGRLYWFGAHAARNGSGGGIGGCSMRLSSEGGAWRNEGLLLRAAELRPPADAPGGTAAAPARGPLRMQRPQVLLNAASARAAEAAAAAGWGLPPAGCSAVNTSGSASAAYVMWGVVLSAEAPDPLRAAGVALARSPRGPFRFLRASRPCGNDTVDLALLSAPAAARPDGAGAGPGASACAPPAPAFLARSFLATTRYLLPGAIMQPLWEPVRQAPTPDPANRLLPLLPGAYAYPPTHAALAYQRGRFDAGYANPNDTAPQRWRGEDVPWQVLVGGWREVWEEAAGRFRLARADGSGLDGALAEGSGAGAGGAAFLLPGALAEGGSGANTSLSYLPAARAGLLRALLPRHAFRTVLGQGRPPIASRWLDPEDPALSVWRPASVPTQHAASWRENAAAGRLVDNPPAATVADVLEGPVEPVFTRRARFIALGQLSQDYTALAGGACGGGAEEQRESEPGLEELNASPGLFVLEGSLQGEDGSGAWLADLSQALLASRTDEGGQLLSPGAGGRAGGLAAIADVTGGQQIATGRQRQLPDY